MLTNIPSPKERSLYLSSQVDQVSMNFLTKEIININEDDQYLINLYNLHGITYTPQPIKIYIDSYGGFVYQCLGLLSVMEKSVTPVHTITTGCAMSCGFLIAITGHHRVAYDKATLMYHQIGFGTGGRIADVEEDIIESRRLQKLVEDHTIKHTKLTKKQIQDNYKSKKDWFMDPKEALKYKVIDEIIK